MVSQALFTVETPAIADTSDAQTLQLGSIIKPDIDGWITAIRWYFPTTLPSGPVKAALFRESDNQRVGGADVTFASPVAAAWNTVQLAAPVAVNANQLMVPVIRTPDRYVASVGGASPWAVPLVNGHLSTAAGAGRFSVSDPDGSVQYPSSQANNGCYFVDYVWTDTLDPDEPEEHDTTGTAPATAAATAARSTSRITAATAAALAAARQTVSGVRPTLGTAQALAGAAAARSTARTTAGSARAVAAAGMFSQIVGRGPLLVTRNEPGRLATRTTAARRIVTSTTAAK